jgi:hypothetical protein
MMNHCLAEDPVDFVNCYADVNRADAYATAERDGNPSLGDLCVEKSDLDRQKRC